MIEQLRFYTRHSLNDLRVNRERTFFALLCIAAGVAAIVSLQTLAGMIANTLTGNLQANNRGDIQLQPINEFEDDDNGFLKRGVDDGILTEQVLNFFGEQVSYLITPTGLETIANRIESELGTPVQVTYRQPITTFINVVFGSGNGTSITNIESGEGASSLNPIVIDASRYPFYSDVQTLDGNLISELLQTPNDVVISQRAADDGNLRVGDEVRLNGAKQTSIIRGIVDDSVEVRNPGVDIFNALYGFYYIDLSAITLFENVTIGGEVGYLQLENPTVETILQVDLLLGDEYPYFEITTTEDLREAYTDLSKAIDDLVSIMGLISMLIGSIGIIITMQVIVRRRTLEVAVLKTLGLQANQITVLFLVEALLMGIIGSVMGVILGWAAVFIIRGAAESLLATTLAFQFVPAAVLNGMVIGVLVTMVFGFLPTLSAGQVRPGIVLRPSDSIIPRAGILRSLGALLIIVIALTLIAQTILSEFGLALAVIVGAFIAVGLLYLMLQFLVWIIGRLFPSLGIVDLKISLRQLLAGRSRAAITLIALVIGVFSLSLITLVAQSVTNLLTISLEENSGGNIAITAANYSQLEGIEATVRDYPGVNSYRVLRNYNLTLVSLTEGDTGQTLEREALSARVEANFDPPVVFETDDEDQTFDRYDFLSGYLSNINVYEPTDTLPDRTLIAGRPLTHDDANQAYVVLRDNEIIQDAGINVGDRLTFIIGDPDEDNSPQITLEVIGIEEQSFAGGGFDGSIYTLRSAFPADLDPVSFSMVVDIAEENVSDLRRELLEQPGVFVFDTAAITRIITALLGTFTAFPTIVAALGLVVGGVVIANSVALTTMERRREIAVMKAVGLQRERVLLMILIENALLGLIGGLIGVGSGLIGLIIFSNSTGIPLDVLPYGTALLLMLLCIAVALLAAITSAWGASGEKPLNVLRYE